MLIHPCTPPAVVRDLNTPCVMPVYRTKEEWLRRADELRTHILVSAGLYPTPNKCPLNAHVFSKVQHDDYSVEKVYFESYPGFLVTGNLYRPVGKAGRRPAVLSPHGHWWDGRLANEDLGSVPGRCIVLARQGYVVFSYDMVGYNDSTQISHAFGNDRKALWGINLLGLQLWNSIRSVDFLCSLPDVDPKRIGCTGESGGGTQTFMLMAVEPRIAAAVPVVMVSAHFQGGCLCENAPNLRIDTFNVEISALMAPRPLLLIAATGDWTKNTPTEEYPAICQIYKLFGAEDKVSYAIFDAPHNYNKASREAMYAWFGKWLLGEPDKSKLKETEFRVDRAPELLVFYGRPHPRPDINEKTLPAALIKESERQLHSLKPTDRESLTRFKRIMEPGLRHALAVEIPVPSDVGSSMDEKTDRANVRLQSMSLQRGAEQHLLPATLVSTSTTASRGKRRAATLIVHPGGRSGVASCESGKLHPLAADLVGRGHLVLTVDCFGTGQARIERDQTTQFFTTYNRTDTAWRVHDILTALTYLRSREDVSSVNLIGLGEAGLWCLLARGLTPYIERTAVDIARFDGTEGAYLKRLYVPSLLRAGGVRTAAALCAPQALLLHNTGGKLDVRRINDVYRLLRAKGNLRVEQSRLGNSSIAEWITHK